MLKFPLSPFCSVSQGFTLQSRLSQNSTFLLPQPLSTEPAGTPSSPYLASFYILATCRIQNILLLLYEQFHISLVFSQSWWLTPIDLHVWEAEAGRSSKNLGSACARWLIPGKFWLYSYTMRFWIKFDYMLFILHVSMCLYAHATAYMQSEEGQLWEWVLSYHCAGSGEKEVQSSGLAPGYFSEPSPQTKNQKGAEEVFQQIRSASLKAQKEFRSPEFM